MSEKSHLTSVNVTGHAKATYDTAVFSCATTGNGKTGPLAKEDARPAIDALTEALDALEASGVKFDRKTATAAYSVQPAYNYDAGSRQNVPNGYQCTYTLTLQSKSVDRASEVHDKLTEVENVVAQSPSFKLKSLTKLHAAALRDAKKKLDSRFADECQALGLDADEYCLDTYQTHYDESESAGPEMAVRAMAASAPAGGGGRRGVQLQSGDACVSVRLTASYRRRTAFDAPAAKAGSATPKTVGAGPARSASAGNGGTA